MCVSSSPARLASAALAIVIAIVAGGCGRGETFDLCGRGDLDDLRRALIGGVLELRWLDEPGEIVARVEVSPSQPERLAFDIPPQAVRLEVEGRDRDGVRVAGGSAQLDAGDACLCVALDAQWSAACAGRACRMVSGRCSFFDAETGEPDGPRTLVFGENLTDDVRETTADTYIMWNVADASFAMLNHGRGSHVRVGTDVDGTIHRGLVRFELGSVPRSAIVEEATLELHLRNSLPGEPRVELRRVLEHWQPGTHRTVAPGVASWTFRNTTDGPWSVPGCGWEGDGPTSSEVEPLAFVTLYEVVTQYSVDVTAIAADWVASPADNAGLLLTADVSTVLEFRAAEHPDERYARSRLRLRYRLD